MKWADAKTRWSFVTDTRNSLRGVTGLTSSTDPRCQASAGASRSNTVERDTRQAAIGGAAGHPPARARDAGAARYVQAAPSCAPSSAASTRGRCGESEQTGSVSPASPAMRNAWQRQPPKSFVFRSHERHGSGIQASPRNRVKASDSFQIHSSDRSRTLAKLRVLIRPAAWHGHTSPAGVTVMYAL